VKFVENKLSDEGNNLNEITLKIETVILNYMSSKEAKPCIDEKAKRCKLRFGISV
jgi:hypothetical protein